MTTEFHYLQNDQVVSTRHSEYFFGVSQHLLASAAKLRSVAVSSRRRRPPSSNITPRM